MVRSSQTNQPIRNILVDQSSHGLLNLGDMAMLQIATQRLGRLFPRATIRVLTSNPQRLIRLCPGTVPVPVGGLHQWALTPLLDRRRMPEVVYNPLLRGAERARLGGGPILRAWLRLALSSRGEDDASLEQYEQAVKQADLVVASGGGYLCDAFEHQARMVLTTLGLAQALGKPTAAFGLGIGPLDDPLLKRRVAQVVRRLDLLTLREAAASEGIVRALHAEPRHLLVTGDEAVEIAYGESTSALGTGIGVNVRLAGYAGPVQQQVPALRRALGQTAESLSSELTPLPVALYPEDSDVEGISHLVAGSDQWAVPDTPGELVERAGRCRVVVTGSYHAGVFALSRGIPVVALAMSRYYELKMQGLSGMFPGGCHVVRLDEGDVARRVSDAIHERWNAAPRLREPLRASARQQIEQARAAYDLLGETLAQFSTGDGAETIIAAPGAKAESSIGAERVLE